MPFAHQKSVIGNFTVWEKRQISNISSLSNQDILKQISDIMGGHNYSWFSISQRLQIRLDNKALELEHFEPGNILYEWNILCDERVSWQQYGRPSFENFEFNRACLINLRILATQAGLGTQGKFVSEAIIVSAYNAPGKRFATSNMDMMFMVSSELAVDNTCRSHHALGEYRGSNGYYYEEGPEFRIEYIHDRVEN